MWTSIILLQEKSKQYHASLYNHKSLSRLIRSYGSVVIKFICGSITVTSICGNNTITLLGKSMIITLLHGIIKLLFYVEEELLHFFVEEQNYYVGIFTFTVS